ncbi:MAG TPA: sulfite reductase [Cytophagales bacterium]|jgi:sulfite reductase (NADPH) flavoprotein alpha-component|nr:sulfite reductase [Cytophagales bacterium]
MLEEIKLNKLNQFVEQLSREELVWLNGYVSGLVKNSLQSEVKQTKVSGKLTIAFATETGNSKKLATAFATDARKQGFTVKLISLDQYRLTDLVSEENFIVTVSTHGEGEPPTSAKKFFTYLNENQLDLSKVRYSVLALGDSAYPLFCKAGEDLDAKLSKLGANRMAPIQKCDVDFEETSKDWFSNVTAALGKKSNGSSVRIRSEKSTGRKMYSGRILTKINLNGSGSLKETYHFEITADDLNYFPGDAIGIVPKNNLSEVESVLRAVQFDQNKSILYKGNETILCELLLNKLSISYLPERLIEKYAKIVNQNIPLIRMDLIDLMKIYPPQTENQVIEIIHSLEPITPRLYSISSSLLAHDGEVHITVAKNCFQLDGVTRHGLCSTYLSSLTENASIDFYVHKNSQFRLPAGDKDVIMIGPGTGIAPFRSFIEERINSGATGKSWLFFGDQHFDSDFLYQTEWQDYVKTGALTKMNVAFSRDQEEKIYVQHKMEQHATELFKWIDSGAYLYVCGAKEPMSVDVVNSVLKIIQASGKSQEQATAYLNQLIEEGRYLKDVY